jgi:hypothetical protein
LYSTLRYCALWCYCATHTEHSCAVFSSVVGCNNVYGLHTHTLLCMLAACVLPAIFNYVCNYYYACNCTLQTLHTAAIVHYYSLCPLFAVLPVLCN